MLMDCAPLSLLHVPECTLGYADAAAKGSNSTAGDRSDAYMLPC